MTDEMQPSLPGVDLPEACPTNDDVAAKASGVGPDAPTTAQQAGTTDSDVVGALGGPRLDRPTTPLATVEHEEGEDVAPPLSAPHPVPGNLYYLTNRLNLNGILSSRIVGPRECYDKYYTDLLELCPGWVPLLTQVPAQNLVDMVSSERGSGGPVVIEFPADLPGLTGRDGLTVVFAPAVSLAQATAIHLRDKRSMKEQQARSYSNIHRYDDLIRLTPELFEGRGQAAVFDAPDTAPPQIDWQLSDRIRGALSAALSAAETGEELRLVARCLGAAVNQEDEAPPWFRWSVLNDLVVADRADRTQNVYDADLGLFEVAYDIFARTDAAEAWSPRAFLDAVETAIEEQRFDAAAVKDIEANLGRVRKIVNVEAEFQPLAGKGGLTSAKAMLLALLRIDLAELNAWPESETGADDEIRLTAAIFAGRLRGLARENVALRSVAFDDVTAKWAVGLAASDGAPVLGDVQFAGAPDRTELILDGLVVRSCQPLLPDPVVAYEAVAEGQREAVRLDVSAAMGWPITTVVRVKGEHTIEATEGGLEIITTDEVELTKGVEEKTFIDRLAATRRLGRRAVLDALAAASESCN